MYIETKIRITADFLWEIVQVRGSETILLKYRLGFGGTANQEVYTQQTFKK